MRGRPGHRGPPRFYSNLDAFLPPPPCRKRAGQARINYPGEWSRRSDFSTSAVLPASPCTSSLVPSSLRPSVPLFVRASPNRNSFRPEVSVAHELRRYVVSPASRHLFFLSPSSSLAQFSYPESDRDRSLLPVLLRPSLRHTAHQKINRVLLVRPRRPAMGAQEGRGERTEE